MRSLTHCGAVLEVFTPLCFDCYLALFINIKSHDQSLYGMCSQLFKFVT